MPAPAHSFRFSAFGRPETRIAPSRCVLHGLQRDCNGIARRVQTAATGRIGGAA